MLGQGSDNPSVGRQAIRLVLVVRRSCVGFIDGEVVVLFVGIIPSKVQVCSFETSLSVSSSPDNEGRPDYHRFQVNRIYVETWISRN